MFMKNKSGLACVLNLSYILWHAHELHKDYDFLNGNQEPISPYTGFSWKGCWTLRWEEDMQPVKQKCYINSRLTRQYISH